MFMSKLTTQVDSRMDANIVATTAGLVRGLHKEDCYIFRGVPYGRARRFQPAQPCDAWEGVREALIYGCDSPLYQTNIARDQHLLPHYYSPQDENCQNLNVWTPSLDEGKKRPVVVWLHGGGFSSGSAVEQFAYDGENMAVFGDLVFVSVNFRLNVLGCLDLSAYGEQYKDSSLAGLSDLVCALCWMHDNIAKFGGNPDNVTLLGHAGGAPGIIALLQTPQADGLYHKISLSSGLFHTAAKPDDWTERQCAQRMAALILENLQLTPDDLSALETMPYWYLAEAAAQAQAQLTSETGITHFRWLPVPDGKSYFGYTSPACLRKEALAIQIMIGLDFGDSRSNARVLIGDGRKNEWDADTTMQHLRDIYGDKASDVAAAFAEAYPNKKLCDALYLDRKTRYTHFDFIETALAAGATLWSWMFTLEFPIHDGLVPFHCVDNAFVTRNAEYMEATFIPNVTPRLQDAMCGAWAAFAHTGDPNHSGLPHWPSASEQQLPTMLFDAHCVVRNNHDAALQEVLTPFRIYE